MEYDIIILSGGCDPLHVGHLRMIQGAAKRAKQVIVGCNSDDWLLRKKGYCFMTRSDREEIVKAINGVSAVISFDDFDDTATDLIRKVAYCYDPKKFNIAFGNGGDRKEGNTPEQEYCEQNSIDMVWDLGGGKVRSSSDIVDTVRRNLNNE